MRIRDYLISKANEYQNDWLTPGRFAEHNALTEEQSIIFLKLAQSVRASNHPDY